MTTWRPAYIALGSNLHNPVRQVHLALEHLTRLADSCMAARSALYRTQPQGKLDQPDFVNAVAALVTTLPARDLLRALQRIESAMGRRQGEKWGPRIIDLDLIWISGAPVDEDGLKVPHPRFGERNFVLRPLMDVAPELEIPGHGTIAQLSRAAQDQGIERIDEQ